MPFHLMAFSESAARNGLDGITPAAPAALEPLGSISGDDFTLNRSTSVVAAVLVSETIANIVEWRFRKTNDPNWMHFNCAAQTTGGKLNVVYPNYPISINEILNAQANNANNAALDTVLLGMGRPGQVSPIPLPFRRAVEGVMSATLTADTWTSGGTVTWSETFEPNRRYQIVGMAYVGATGHAARIVNHAMGQVEKPGCFGCGANPEDNVAPTWGDFGAFVGTSPPTFEFLADAGDTAEIVTLFLN